MAFPEAYRERAQTYLKHVFLEDYLLAWGFKLAHFKQKLWYVDCFAGPWESKAANLADTSIHIGLKSLRTLAASYRAQGKQLQLGAIFIENNAEAFAQLKAYVDANSDGIDVRCFHGTFAEKAADVERVLGNDPAFVFVDPWGWRGAEMKHIEPFLRPLRRDVLVNVMFNFINIAQGNRNAELQRQLADFFGMSRDETLNASGEQMFALYRRKLTENCETKWTAVLPIPHKAADRTWFGLVVGGHDPTVLDVFRTAEAKVAVAAGEARESEKRDARGKRKSSQGQPELLLNPSSDPIFEERHRVGLAQLETEVLRAISSGGRRFDEIWPPLLAELSVTKRDVAAAILELKNRNLVEVLGLVAPKRAVQDDHFIRRVVMATSA